MAATESRPLRADAQRNRDRLLAVAAHAFSEDGPEVTLDSIAKDAGVGIGTLYRHFPTREALVEATYRNELARLCDAADDLLRDLPPDQATRQWMDGFIGYMDDQARHGRRAAGGGRVRRRPVRGEPGPAAGGGGDHAPSAWLGRRPPRCEAGVQPGDVLASLSGVSLTAGEPAQREQACWMLDLLMDGLRYRG